MHKVMINGVHVATIYKQKDGTWEYGEEIFMSKKQAITYIKKRNSCKTKHQN